MPNEFFNYSKKVKKVCLLDKEKPKIKLPEKYKDIIIFDLDDLNRRPLPFLDNTFDTVVLGEVLEHLYYPINLLNELKRIIKSKGLLIISTPSPKYYLEIINMLIFSKPIGFPEHKFLFTRNQMKNILDKNGFKVMRVIGYNFWLPFIKLGFIQLKYKWPEIFTWQQIYITKK